jgi:hypothetical protein
MGKLVKSVSEKDYAGRQTEPPHYSPYTLHAIGAAEAVYLRGRK